METRLAHPTWNLQDGGTISLAAAEGWKVVVERGQAWLTIEGHSQDKWLFAGDRFEIPGAGHVLIEADRPSRVRLEAPPPSMLSRLATAMVLGLRRTGRAMSEASVYSPERMGCHSSR